MTNRSALLALAASLAAAPLAGGAPALAQGGFTLSIVHTNDLHSRVEPVTASGAACAGQDLAQGRCLGGFPRVVTRVRELRALSPSTLVLDAGDYFQGSLHYTQFKSDAVKPFLEMIGYDAVTLGNHEFDDGPAELARFLEGFRIPVVAANVDVSAEPRLQGRFSAHRVLDVGGRRVGVVGLTTQDTAITSSPGPTVRFQDHAEALRREVAALRAQGVDVIVALTHVGAAEDRRLAEAVDGVDVFVGGHSHTLFRNADDPRRGAEYPVVVRTPSGAPALVVQAFFGGMYVGRLEVEFDAAGVPVRWSGDTVPVDASVAPDPQAQALAERMAGPLAELRARAVAPAAAALDGDRESCRQRECTLGNLIADAMLAATREAGTQVALQNGGGIRASIPAGTVTFGQVLEVLPFSNAVSTFRISGADLLAALENGVSQAESMQNPGTGRFPQVAGMRFSWDAARPAGQRVVSAEVRRPDGSFAPLDPAAEYRVATNDFVRRGGDGYAVFRDRARDAYDGGPNLEDVLADHLRRLGTADPRVEGRITRVN